MQQALQDELSVWDTLGGEPKHHVESCETKFDLLDTNPLKEFCRLQFSKSPAKIKSSDHFRPHNRSATQ
jgi:hypothetical protein